MRIIILTNEIHKEFVQNTLWAAMKSVGWEGQADVYWANSKYPFEFSGKCDVGVSFMYQHRVPKEEIDKHPWFNFHPAPLPEYKGRNLCYHAIMNGETEFGATVHYMDENFDTGDIIHVGKFAIEDWMTAEDVSSLALTMSESLFTWFLPRILVGENFLRYPNGGGHYYKKSPIEDCIPLRDAPLERWIRAVTYKDFYPKVNIGGVVYKIVKE